MYARIVTKKILPRNKWKFDQPQELISASGDTMTALGNLDIDIFLSPNTKPIQTTICTVSYQIYRIPRISYSE